MAASTRDRKRTIVSALERRGALSRREIETTLDEAGCEPMTPATLSKMLRQMLSAHLLRKVRYGVYDLAPNYRLRGVDTHDRMEAAIEKFLEACGGVAKTKAIHDAVGDRPLGGMERGYGHRLITLTLKESPRFQQDFGRGFWNLEPGRLTRLPLSGQWANYQIQARWADRDHSRGFETWEEERDSFFDAVGSAFTEARAKRSLADVVCDPDICVALREMADKAPGARSKALESVNAEITAECRAGGVTNEFEIARTIRERKAIRLAQELYAAFENGSVALHLAAPAQFYRACAALYGVCPAQLSRGVVHTVPTALYTA